MRNIIKQILKEEINSQSERVKSIVNKYGIGQAIEMVVGGPDTIINAYQDNPESFLDQFNDLTPVEKDDKIFYIDKDGLPLFYYFPDEKNGYVYFNYDRIWMFFSDVIGLKYSEIQTIINNWLEVTYNISGLTPKVDFSIKLSLLEETYNLRELTPTCNYRRHNKQLEETYNIK